MPQEPAVQLLDIPGYWLNHLWMLSLTVFSSIDLIEAAFDSSRTEAEKSESNYRETKADTGGNLPGTEYGSGSPLSMSGLKSV